MKNKMISSHQGSGRNVPLAFTGSLLFTGLGQLYTAQAVKGLTFLMLRIAVAGVFPVLLYYNRQFPLFYTMAGCLLADIIIVLTCAFHAGISAGRNEDSGFKQYMRMPFYILYGAGVLLVQLYIYGMLISMISVNTVHDSNMRPSMVQGDVVVVVNFPGISASAGDMVTVYTGERKEMRRVVAAGPENIIIRGSTIKINNTALETTILTDTVAERLKLENREEYYLERNDNIVYPVMIPGNEKKNRGNLSMLYLEKDQVLLASDTRTADVWFMKVDIEDINGKAAGVLHSPQRGIWLMPLQ